MLSLQLCLTLCNNPTGSSVQGVLQARILEQIAMPFSRGSSRPRNQTTSLMSPALAVRSYTTSTTWEAPIHICIVLIMYLLQILWILIFILNVVHFLSFPWPSSKIVKRIQLKLKEWTAKRLNRQLPSKQSWNESFSICKYYNTFLKGSNLLP